MGSHNVDLPAGRRVANLQRRFQHTWRIQRDEINPAHVVGIAILMVTPIVMVVLTLMLGHPANRWANVIVGGFFFIFNLIGLPTYPSAYDKFLIAVSLVFNVLTVWYAWNWIH